MHWLKKTEERAGVVRFKVVGGYEYHATLRDRGFDFNRRDRSWVLEIPLSDHETILATEKFLKAADKLDQKAAMWRKLERSTNAHAAPELGAGPAEIEPYSG